jgi:peptidoglycan/LPS O-acetylase OafA/YrhL
MSASPLIDSEASPGTTSSRPNPRTTDASGSFRADIEGLRAVAVLLVIVNHLFGWPRGGFVGVDVFFVISGFLITGLLLSGAERDGYISFRKFYARRARRILPAALMTLMAVTAAARLVYPGTARVQETDTDSLWALGFGANIHFAQIGTDYFQTDRAPSLVQHFWSLAVEEQFYLVWPVVMVLVLALNGRSLPQRRARLTLLAVVAAGTAGSFAWGLQQSATAPATAYFSAPVRAWELGVGAFVATAATCFRGLFRWLGRAAGPLSVLGLAGIVAGSLLVKATSSFPVPGAALPVGATALVIVAGIGAPPGRWGALLTNRVSRYVGRISYSLYLLHWPVIIVVGSLMPTETWLRYPISLLAMMGASVASYHFVEAPFRKVRLPRVRKASIRTVKLRPEAIPVPSRQSSRSFARHVLASASLLSLAVALSLFVPPRPAPTFALPLVTPTAAAPTAPAQTGPIPTATASKPTRAIPLDAVAQPSPQIANGINRALASTRFPRFDPSLDRLTIKSAHTSWGGCQSAIELKDCSFGKGNDAESHIVVVIGDSYAMSWMPAIEAALPGADWKVYGIEMALCPAAYVSMLNSQRLPFTACDQRHLYAANKAKSLDPDLVILASSPDNLDRIPAKIARGENAAVRAYEAGMVKMIRALSPTFEHRVLTLTAPPTTTSLQSCVSAQSVPASCVTKIRPRWRAVAAAEKRAAEETRTSYSDTHLWFCNGKDYCPAFVGNTPMRWDTGHLTPAYAKMLGPDLAGVLQTVLR